MYGLDGGQLGGNTGLTVLWGEDDRRTLGFGLNAWGELICSWLSPVAGECALR